MAEENEPVEAEVVDSESDDNYLAIASEDTSLAGAELEAAGVDMRVTKADILELVTAQMKEQLEADFETLKREQVVKEHAIQEAVHEYVRETYPELLELYEKTTGHPPATWLEEFKADGYRERETGWFIFVDNLKVVDLPKAQRLMDKWLVSHGVGEPYHRQIDDPTQVVFSRKKKKREMTVHLFAKFEVDEEDIPSGIHEAIKARDEIKKKIDGVVKDYRDMHKVERKARYQLANKILSATKEGKKLLKNLNNFKTRKVRALKA